MRNDSQRKCLNAKAESRLTEEQRSSLKEYNLVKRLFETVNQVKETTKETEATNKNTLTGVKLIESFVNNPAPTSENIALISLYIYSQSQRGSKEKYASELNGYLTTNPELLKKVRGATVSLVKKIKEIDETTIDDIKKVNESGNKAGIHLNSIINKLKGDVVDLNDFEETDKIDFDVSEPAHEKTEEIIEQKGKDVPVNQSLEKTPISDSGVTPPLEETPISATGVTPPLEETPVSATGVTPPLEETPQVKSGLRPPLEATPLTSKGVEIPEPTKLTPSPKKQKESYFDKLIKGNLPDTEYMLLEDLDKEADRLHRKIQDDQRELKHQKRLLVSSPAIDKNAKPAELKIEGLDEAKERMKIIEQEINKRRAELVEDNVEFHEKLNEDILKEEQKQEEEKKRTSSVMYKIKNLFKKE